jgi:hypothetical protein
MYIYGVLLGCLIGMYFSYRLGHKRGVGKALDFMVCEVLEDNGYIVTYHEDKIEVLPKYRKEWYYQRTKSIPF